MRLSSKWTWAEKSCGDLDYFEGDSKAHLARLAEEKAQMLEEGGEPMFCHLRKPQKRNVATTRRRKLSCTRANCI
jgi:hypothetical protein